MQILAHVIIGPHSADNNLLIYNCKLTELLMDQCCFKLIRLIQHEMIQRAIYNGHL